MGSSFNLQCPFPEEESEFDTPMYISYISFNFIFLSFVLVLENYIFPVLCNMHPKLAGSTEGFHKELHVELSATE